ncbi:hypothetical protein [Nocardia nepalensis]
MGRRKIAALMRADGVSTSTVERALRRRGPMLPRPTTFTSLFS